MGDGSRRRSCASIAQDNASVRLALGLGGSVALHGLLAALLLGGLLQTSTYAAEAPGERVVSFEVVEALSPEALEPEPAPPEPEPPAPEPVAAPAPPQPRKAPDPPLSEAPAPAEPPPPAQPPPPSSDPLTETAEPTPEPVPLHAGISMRSTVGKGEGASMRVGVGSTLYGRPDEVARDPSEARRYSGGRVPESGKAVLEQAPAEAYVPPHRVSTLPRVRREVRAGYPEAARREEIEGRVVLRVLVDEEGAVVEAEVVEGPGYGLDEAAREALLEFRFQPATLDGRPVATELRYVYTFLLD